MSIKLHSSTFSLRCLAVQRNFGEHESQLRPPLAHFSPRRIVNDNGATISKCFDRMTDVAWHNPYQTRSNHLLHAVDGQFEFAFDDLVDLFLRMEVLVEGGAALEVVVGEGHAGGMKVASIPSRQALHAFWW